MSCRGGGRSPPGTPRGSPRASPATRPAPTPVRAGSSGRSATRNACTARAIQGGRGADGHGITGQGMKVPPIAARVLQPGERGRGDLARSRQRRNGVGTRLGTCSGTSLAPRRPGSARASRADARAAAARAASLGARPARPPEHPPPAVVRPLRLGHPPLADPPGHQRVGGLEELERLSSSSTTKTTIGGSPSIL